MKVEVPPCGRQLTFEEWTRLLTVRLRAYIPDVAAATQGSDRVVWRYRGAEVSCTQDRGTFWIRFGAIAGHLDAKHSTPD